MPRCAACENPTCPSHHSDGEPEIRVSKDDSLASICLRIAAFEIDGHDDHDDDDQARCHDTGDEARNVVWRIL
jgi:hypothetical protein